MSTPDEAAQSDALFDRYPPALAALGRAVRARLQARLPGFFEIVYLYARQESLVIAFSPSEHGYEGVCSLAVHPDRVLLHFNGGDKLADPHKLLQGRGKAARHVVVGAAEDLDHPALEALVVSALALSPRQSGAAGRVILKVESQRARAEKTKRGATREPG